jgi:hypothetical protein
MYDDGNDFDMFDLDRDSDLDYYERTMLYENEIEEEDDYCVSSHRSISSGNSGYYPLSSSNGKGAHIKASTVIFILAIVFGFVWEPLALILFPVAISVLLSE